MAGRAPRVRRVRRPGRPLRFAIVAARFNERITERLVQGALEAFRGARLSGDAVDVHWVPGSFELPQAAGHLAATGRYAAIVSVDRKSTRLNSSHLVISYAVFCL